MEHTLDNTSLPALCSLCCGEYTAITLHRVDGYTFRDCMPLGRSVAGVIPIEYLSKYLASGPRAVCSDG
jgi:hypothetical protein